MTDHNAVTLNLSILGHHVAKAKWWYLHYIILYKVQLKSELWWKRVQQRDPKRQVPLICQIAARGVQACSPESLTYYKADKAQVSYHNQPRPHLGM